MYDAPTSQVLDRGQVFFNKCYGKVAERVMASLDHCGTEDLGLAIRLTYGYVLSTTAVLSEAETSFVMIAGLVPQDVSLETRPLLAPPPLPCSPPQDLVSCQKMDGTWTWGIVLFVEYRRGNGTRATAVVGVVIG